MRKIAAPLIENTLMIIFLPIILKIMNDVKITHSKHKEDQILVKVNV